LLLVRPGKVLYEIPQLDWALTPIGIEEELPQLISKLEIVCATSYLDDVVGAWVVLFLSSLHYEVLQ
jgi:hypothetical protein